MESSTKLSLLKEISTYAVQFYYQPVLTHTKCGVIIYMNHHS